MPGLLLDINAPPPFHAHHKIDNYLGYENLAGSWNCHFEAIGLTFNVKTTVRAIVETWKLTNFCVILK